MQTIFDVFNFIRFVSDKYDNGFASPENISQALDAGQQTVHQQYLRVYDESTEAKDALAPFLKISSVSTSADGMLAYPNDYARLLGAYVWENMPPKQVREVRHDELEEALKSTLYPVSYRAPIGLRIATGMQVYPKMELAIEQRYIAKPTTPKVDYTVGANNELAYNPGGSVQLGFDNKYWLQIILLSLPYIGVSIDNQALLALSTAYNNTQPIAA